MINFCDDLRADEDAYPQNYWSNTSGNAIVRRLIDKADSVTKNEVESLIAGDEVIKEIHQELTYNELDQSIENLWSVLFTTGYLTQRGRVDGRKYRLAIPNREIRELFITQIREWFRQSSRKDTATFSLKFQRAGLELWWKSNMQKMQHLILPAIRQSNRLRKSIMRQHCMGMVWRML